MDLIVKNFGPIKDAHIQTKRYNVLIGNTSTGKSVLAKLISIAYEIEFYFIENGNFDAFAKLLKKYCIDFPFSDSTQIEISFALAHWIITKDSFRIIKSIGSPFFKQSTVNISNNKDVAYLYREISIDKNMENDLDPNNPIVEEAKKTYKELVDNIAHNQKTDLSQYSQPAIDLAYRAFMVYVYDKNASVYVPAERNLMSVFTNNIFSFLKSGANIPESIKRFGSLYEAAKGENKNLSIDFMNIKVDFANEDDKIVLDDAGTEIRFEQASSGMQSIIPLWTVYLYGIKKHVQATAIIEEPELNLFPTLQVDLVNNLVAQLNQTKANLLITTHSPYILSVLDNLIYANDVYQKAKAADNKEQIQRIEKLVKPSMLINYDEVAAYLCKDDGVVERMNDDEMRNTGAYALDKASTITSHIFNELMDIENEL
ncbi:MAG: ATP-binding protein [Paludibacteraceae bacterium]|nr:ATP-binding protein [Paludibacteraceae bacterium]